MFKELMRGLGKAGAAVVKTAAPVVLAAVTPEAIINTAVGAVAKHGISKLPNGAIPYLNLGISSAVSYAKNVVATGDWAGSVGVALQEGGVLAGASTLLHQSLKLPLRTAVSSEKWAKRVGPGETFSL
jgi:hypothetical protein